MSVIEAWAGLPPEFIAGREIPARFFWRNTRRASLRTPRGSDEVDFDWERDFPLYARERRGAQRSTVINLEFELDSDEQEDFRAATGISTNHRLPIEVRIDSKAVSLLIPKQGKGSHKEKAKEIAGFVADRISVLHIPAVRTGSTATKIAERILSSRRRSILRTPEYAELLGKIEALEEEAVGEVEDILKNILKRFAPGIESVNLEVRGPARGIALSDIVIDDGVATSIAVKGDGMQSLVALALTLEWTRSKNDPDRMLIVAVEEPESHLHPGAVHELRKVLQGIADSQQVIVTTHSQTLVNRRETSRNVIVGDRAAKPAKSLEEIREALGVRLSDALAPTEVIVILEGWLDNYVLPPLLVQHDPIVKEWIDDGRVEFEATGSGSKIYARALAARNILTEPVVVIDGDEAGLRDVARLQEDGVVDPTAVVRIKRTGFTHAEMEDIFLLDVYVEAVEDAVGFTLRPKQRRRLDLDRSAAWSERLEQILDDAGVSDVERLTKRAKRALADAVVDEIGRGGVVVRSEAEDLLDRLIDVIRRNLQSR